MNILKYDSIVLGTGAAGYNAANRLKESGKNVAIVTEGVNIGTSRNTGSDKQTYYKLGLGGDVNDSVRTMAENLFSCGATDGDNALCEAALSSRCFMNLVELGVPFPVNRYGEYVGYKTDHDPYARATSAGPLTSKFMTEALQNKAKMLEIDVYDGYLAIEILKKENSVCGLLCLEISSGELVAFSCNNIILCTGGPAGIYSDSVYPECHTGSTSLALMAGAKAQNLTEWQYGLASVNPRWNVSGTYMQVLPRFVSIDENGNEREFLADYFSDINEALSMVFLKGYQWPFDSKKILDGSSVIDLLVYVESVIKGRKVYLDYTRNSFNLENIAFDRLIPEAYDYLSKAQVLFGTPIERLRKMNFPAIELYRNKGVDLEKEYLEIALCAQHNNGGIAVDKWWQTNISGLFAAGECAGTHGVTRPGGSALNSGQVGSLRAATFIANFNTTELDESEFENIAELSAKQHRAFANEILADTENVQEILLKSQHLMSEFGAAIRVKDSMEKAKNQILTQLEAFNKTVSVKSKRNLWLAYKLKDILIVQLAVLTAFIDFAHKVGSTRGSALYYDEDGELREGLSEEFRFKLGSNSVSDKIQSIQFENGKFEVEWRNVRPLPQNDDFFENVWRGYRENKNVF